MGPRSLFLPLLLALAAVSPLARAAPSDPDEENEVIQDLFDVALAAFAQGDYAGSQHLLEALIRLDPDNALYWFNLGNSHFKQGRYDSAADAYRKVKKLKSPLAPAASLYLAKSLRLSGDGKAARRELTRLRKKRLPEGIVREIREEELFAFDPELAKIWEIYKKGDLEEAEEALRALLARKPSDEVKMLHGMALLRLGRTSEAGRTVRGLASLSTQGTLRRDAVAILEKIEQGTRPGPASSWAFLDGALGYNSNVNLDASGANPDKAPQLSVSLGAGRVFPRGNGTHFRIGYRLGWEEIAGSGESRFIDNLLFGSYLLSRYPWTFQFGPTINHQVLGERSLLLALGTELTLQYGHRRWEWGLRFSHARNFGQNTVYTYLDGTQFLARAFAGHRKGKWDVQLSYLVFGENTGVLSNGAVVVPLAHLGHGPEIRAALALHPEWDASARFGLRARGYSDLAQPGGVRRHDTQLLWQLRLAHRLTPSLRASASTGLLLNRSTLGESSGIDDKNYTQFTFLAGLSWDILR